MNSDSFVVRFAGEGGQGMVTSAELLASAFAQTGYHVKTFATFPSQILGGPTWTQARISTTPVHSYGDSLDLLVAFNKAAYEEHNKDVSDTGLIIYESGDFQLEEDSRRLGIAFEELGKSTGNNRAANMVILGALAQLIDIPPEMLDDFVTKRFTRGRPGDEDIIKSNIKALGLGREMIQTSEFRLAELAPPTLSKNKQLLIKGNDALSLGAIAGGLDFYIGYPISPATSILVYMERNLLGADKFAYQASSEIESITTIVGAGYAGKKSMTATSGPGFSLMSEGIGMAWMMEVPCVIVNVQRGGPATGLPTKTEQSDFLSALHPAHGDAKIPILAPGTVEECFYAAIKALNWAERYQGPVVVLSEHMLSEQTQNIPSPDLEKIVVESRKRYEGQNGYKRYDGKELSPMPMPGNPGSYVANASEHDPMGDTTHLGDHHINMTERRFGKLSQLDDDDYEAINNQESIAVMSWGGSKGPCQEAYEKLMEDGIRLGWYYTIQLHPLPSKLLEELKAKELVIVPELNYQGQFAGYLRSLGVKTKSITQYNGIPFKVSRLEKELTEICKSHRKAQV